LIPESKTDNTIGHASS